MKRPIHLLIAGSLLVLQISLAVPVASAHGSEDEHSQESAAPAVQDSEQKAEEETDKKTQDKPASYEFVAEPGCSLSLLVRRALQLYDQQKDDVLLTPAAAIYAETNIVQELGSRLLAIGERVKIDQPLLDKYVQKSKALSPETLAAWNTYAADASFKLDDIAPATTTAPAVTDKPATDTDTAEDQPKDDEQAKKDAEANRQPLSALWWLAGIATLAGIYYLLGRRKTS